MSDSFFVPSERLKDLRSISDGWKELEPWLGKSARFSLVIDTNVVLGDILWLVAGRRDQSAKTHLMETIEAGTLDVFVPQKLIDEVEEKIPLIAADKGLDEELMQAEWRLYREMLNIGYPDEKMVQALRHGVDPDDADFVALAQTIGAGGIFSKDKHIGLMGGNTISIECVAHLRDYSRSAAVELNIKVNGVVFSIIGMKAINALMKGGKQLIQSIGASPDWVKVLLFCGVAYVVLNPRARETVGGYLNGLFSQLDDVLPKVLSLAAEASSIANSRGTEALSHLKSAQLELNQRPTASE